jgi:hypothetical protein
LENWTVSQEIYTKLMDEKVLTGKWKPGQYFLGNHSDSGGSIRHLYQRKKNSNRCVMLGHLAFSKDCGTEAMKERRKFVVEVEIRNKTIIDIHDGQSNERLFVLHRRGLIVNVYFPMFKVPKHSDCT